MFAQSRLIAVPISVLIASLFSVPAAFAQVPGGSLDPTTISKYVSPLTIPPAMPKTNVLPGGIDYYEIAVRQFQQQVLPAGMPRTTVWGYGSPNHAGTFSYPSRTIEAQVDRPVRVKWINDLKDPVTGKFLPHLFAVDQTLHWANPPQDCIDGLRQPDCHGKNPAPYTGPVPIVTHLHGSHVTPDSDGYPEAWYLPNASNIPAGYARRGSHFDQIPGAPNVPGAALFQYRNDQRATALWFHDHALGMTRNNVYGEGQATFRIFFCPAPPPNRAMRQGRNTTRSPSSFRIAPLTKTGHCSTPTTGPFSKA
jgi:spore coat protein A, manganese oxidase